MQNHPIQSTRLADSSGLHPGADSEVQSTESLASGSIDAYKSASRLGRQIIRCRLLKLVIVGRLYEGPLGNAESTVDE